MRATLLTGATDGIGLELARLWRGRGEQPFLHGRRPVEELDRTLLENGRYVRADLSDPQAPERIARFLAEHGVEALDRLVLNAAEGWVGAIEDQPLERTRELIEVDLLAPLRLCHLLIPRLERARGRIVFVSSIAAQLASPRYAVYAAAKAAAEGFFRSLRIELAGSVEVQVLRLGAVRTALHAKSGLASEEIGWERFPRPAEVALAIDRRLDGPPRWRTIGAGNRALFALARSLPALADRWRKDARPRAGAEPRQARSCAITGAARGIGRALAERFGRAGYAVLAIDVDRRANEGARSELERAGIAFECLEADLAREEGVRAVLDGLRSRPPLDVVIHNAGISSVGRFAASPWTEARRVIAVNLLAPLFLTAGILRQGRLAERGAFVFISSLSRFVSYPGAAAYAASKDGLASYARSLRAALEPRGGRVLTVYPGPTRTEHARRHGPPGAREARRMAPEELAERVFRALERRSRVLVPGTANRAFAALGHALPALAERAMKRAILDRLGDRREER